MGSAFGGSAPSGQQVYQPNWLSGADTSFQNIIQNRTNNNPYQAAAPQAQATFNQQYNNPYTQGYQTAANNAGGSLSGIGNLTLGNSNALSGQVSPQIAAANQVMQLGLDPQSSLYQQQLQKARDQANVQNAQSGVSTSPYGASVANNAVNQFNMDWQNNQLQRAIQGLQGYDSGISSAGNTAGNAASLGGTGANYVLQGGDLPYTTNNAITGNQSSALTNLLSILGNSGGGAYDTSSLNSLLSYLGVGAAQSNQQAQLNQSATNNAQSGIGDLIGSGLEYGPSAYTAFSDSRLKKDIKLVGKENGHNIYEFSYIGNATKYRGVMAQEVARIVPDAVHKHDSGFLMVDYSKIGVEPKVVA